ncbi:MAG: phosphoadenosine phosphosulfate reductase family protein [Gammaproteobacteria bacterium]
MSAKSNTMRHIISLSGGKDSTALALYMRQAFPEIQIEYVFCDTGREFPDLYRFLDDLEDVLESPISRLTDYGRTFDFYLEHWGWFLPGKQSRWCTKHLKLRPIERYCKQGLPCTVYIGLRADEPEREGNYGISKGIDYAYPLREACIDLNGVMNILSESQIKLPKFYAWRTTGGCWMCPWQRESEWLGLSRHEPELFAQALAEEKKAEETSKDGHGTTWSLSRKPLQRMLDDYERQVQMFPDYEFDLRERYDSRPCIICAK